MSLGSIAHLQYYFARTGILDGKGGRDASERRSSSGPPRISISNSAEDSCLSNAGRFGDIVDGPIEEESELLDWDGQMMLPPTVSTYSHRVPYIQPPPKAEDMRSDLIRSLKDVTKALQEVRESTQNDHYRRRQDAASTEEISNQQESEMQGWYQVQGMNILDVVTLAIRAAKIYYTMHEHPQRLGGIKSERQIREELLGVLDVLKRLASRNFAGGLKDEEIRVIDGWRQSVDVLLDKELAIEKQEEKDRENWTWLAGNWRDEDRGREYLFMNAFINATLPEWTKPEEHQRLPTPFLASLRNGLTLVHLHNTILKKSRRQFGEIKTFHTDTAKPYRCAENLRFWIKAAEIRWETKLQVDVMGVVYGKGEGAWRAFDSAIYQWCQAVRREITQEWREGLVQVPTVIMRRAPLESNSWPGQAEMHSASIGTM